MKLHFEPNLDYQLQAIEAVCGLFQGQEICRTEFTVVRDNADMQMRMGFAENDLGIGNRLLLLPDEIAKNLSDIQLRNTIKPSFTLGKPFHLTDNPLTGDFTVEMETGTGKTYVYLRTIFELNKRFGFTKFVIVVPSVAIKEGVYHTIETAAEHLKTLYAATPFDFFIYDSAKLGQVRNFATSPQIQIMVMTVGAINKFGDEEEAQMEETNEAARREKSKNVMYRPSEKTGGEKPIDLIRDTHPILIVDEPQSVEGGLDGKGTKAMKRMRPLCKLRYSATPREAHHMVFKLDAVDAYERKLVKQIEVAAASVEGGNNKPFVRFVSAVRSGKSIVGAKVELEVATAQGSSRKTVTVYPLDDLVQASKGRQVYRDHAIGDTIRDDLMELRFPGNEKFLKIGEAYGDVAKEPIERQMIRRTIKEHLDKEKRLAPQGIKVLSLFFIDAVEKYRQYDADGNAVKGVYAKIFEEEYRKLSKYPEYQVLFKEVDVTTAAEEVHNGYFSIDKKKIGKKTVEVFKNSSGDTKADDDTYSLIMRDKEKLLSFDTPLKFIFSHSALREGWDNPNVFQICALREMHAEQQRRQTIGRGLRLCVNQQGERLHGFEINTLTVIATESYEQFAENLQSEIEEETGIEFGKVEHWAFAGVSTTGPDGRPSPLGFDQSKVLLELLKAAGLVNAQGKIQDALKQKLKDGTLTLPEPFAAQLPQVKEILRKLAGRLEIKNADERKQVKSRQAVLQGADFKALWDRIKHKTTYRVQFDNEKLLLTCIAALQDPSFVIAKTRLQWRKADLAIGRAGVEATETKTSAPVTLDEGDIELPDILTDLQDKTSLTRRSIHRILVDSGRLDDFKRNPQQFIELAAEIINRSKRMALVDGIKYQRIGAEEYYAQQLFETEELTGYLKSMINADKSVHEQVIYQSDTERTFAEQLEKNEAIKVYAKLPGWFKVPTPLGPYNPDWAVLVDKDGTERLYFVVETKSSLFTDDLRDKESAKIKCGEAHFAELATHNIPAAQFIKATKLEDLLAKC